MQEYVGAVLLALAVAALCSLLLPGRDEKMRRLLEMGLSLLVLTVLCRPLSGEFDLSKLFSGLVRPPAADGQYSDFLEENRGVIEQAIAEGVAADLAARYAVPLSCVRAEVQAIYQDGEWAVGQLRLYLSGRACLLDLYAVRQYAAGAYQTECEVMIDGT